MHFTPTIRRGHCYDVSYRLREIEMTTKINSNVARRLGVRRFDASEYLRDEADIAAYLEAAAAEEDPRVLAAALGDVARARGMSELARKTGITREALYRSLSADGNPELSTLTKVLRALGMRLTIQPAGT
jgi:probable addiction module antidote protein